MADSVDPDEMAYQDLNCLHRCWFFNCWAERVKGKGITLRRGKSVKLFFLPYEKGSVYTKRKEFALEGTPFQKGFGVQESKQQVTKNCLP